MDRDQHLLELRPQLYLDTAKALPEEQFQNHTLLPILRLQNDLLLAIFENYLDEKSIRFAAMADFKKRLTIENAVKKDLPLRHTLAGCIIGHFTSDEYHVFLKNRVAINKTITAMLIQRITEVLVISRNGETK